MFAHKHHAVKHCVSWSVGGGLYLTLRYLQVSMCAMTNIGCYPLLDLSEKALVIEETPRRWTRLISTKNNKQRTKPVKWREVACQMFCFSIISNKAVLYMLSLSLNQHTECTHTRIWRVSANCIKHRWMLLQVICYIAMIEAKLDRSSVCSYVEGCVVSIYTTTQDDVLLIPFFLF